MHLTSLTFPAKYVQAAAFSVAFSSESTMVQSLTHLDVFDIGDPDIDIFALAGNLPSLTSLRGDYTCPTPTHVAQSMKSFINNASHQLLWVDVGLCVTGDNDAETYAAIAATNGRLRNWTIRDVVSSNDQFYQAFAARSTDHRANNSADQTSHSSVHQSSPLQALHLKFSDIVEIDKIPDTISSLHFLSLPVFSSLAVLELSGLLITQMKTVTCVLEQLSTVKLTSCESAGPHGDAFQWIRQVAPNVRHLMLAHMDDLLPEFITLAAPNLRSLELKNVTFRVSDWLKQLAVLPLNCLVIEPPADKITFFPDELSPMERIADRIKQLLMYPKTLSIAKQTSQSIIRSGLHYYLLQNLQHLIFVGYCPDWERMLPWSNDAFRCFPHLVIEHTREFRDRFALDNLKRKGQSM